MNWIQVGFVFFLLFSVLQLPAASKAIRLADPTGGDTVHVSVWWIGLAWLSYACLLSPTLRYLAQQFGFRDFGSAHAVAFMVAWVTAIFCAMINHSLLRAIVIHCRINRANLMILDSVGKFSGLKTMRAPGKSDIFE